MAKLKPSDRSLEEVDEIMGSLLSEHMKSSSPGAVLAGDLGTRVPVGIPIPSLVMRYVLARPVLPLSGMNILAGSSGSGKSALMFDMFRWVRECHGRSVYLSNESRTQYDFGCAITNYDKNAVSIMPTSTSDMWMKQSIGLFKFFKSKMEGTKSKPGVGRIAPWCVGLDSMTARDTADQIENLVGTDLKEAKAPAKAFPALALQLSQFLKVVPQMIEREPILYLLTAHEKVRMDGNEHVVHIPGGQAPIYHSTYIFDMTRIRNELCSAPSEIALGKAEGILVQIRTHKNTFGPKHRSTKVRLLTWREPSTDAEGNPVAKLCARWDWATADADFLAAICAPGDGEKKVGFTTELAHQIRDVAYVQIGQKTPIRKYTCPQLGFMSENACSAEELMEAFWNDEKIVQQIQMLVGIYPGRYFVPGVDYLEQCLA